MNLLVNIVALSLAISTASATTTLRATVACNACQQGVLMAKQLAHKSPSPEIYKTQLELALKYHCDGLPILTDRKKCNEDLAAYGSQMAGYMAVGYSPLKVCQLIKKCTKESGQLVMSSNIEPRMIKSSPRGQVAPVDTCELCLNVISILKTTITDNSTLPEIEEALKHACDNVSPMDRELQCLNYVSAYGTHIAALIAEGIDINKVCYWLNQCPSEELETIQLLQSSQMPEICDLCQNITEYLVQFFTPDSSVSDIEEVLSHACDDFPADKKLQCLDYVAEFSPDIIALILDKIDINQLCFWLNQCPSHRTPECKSNYLSSNVHQALLASFNSLQDVDCNTCMSGVATLKNIINQPTTPVELVHFFKLVCDNAFPDNLKSQCDSAVAKYGDEIAEHMIQLITASLDPHEVCVFIKKCPAESETSQIESSFAKIAGLFNGLDCTLCQNAINTVKTEMTETHSVDIMVQFFKKVCDSAFPDLKNQCDSAVATYGQQVAYHMLTLIAQELDPHQVCVMLKKCPAELRAAPRTSYIKPSSSNAVPRNFDDEENGKCFLCENVLRSLNDFINENSTRVEIENAFKFVCDNAFPEELRPACDEYVARYGSHISVMLSEGLNPHKICIWLNQCFSSLSDQLLSNIQIKSVKESSECELCRNVSRILEKSLNSNSTINEIEFALEHVCDEFPQEEIVECTSYIAAFGPHFAALIIDGIDLSKACYWLNQCPTKESEATNLDTRSLEPLNILNVDDCALCQAITSSLKGQITKDSTYAEIEMAIRSACDIDFPIESSNECADFIAAYGTQMAALINEQVDLDHVCIWMNQCSTSSNSDVFTSNIEPRGFQLSMNTMKKEAKCSLCEVAIMALSKEAKKPNFETIVESKLNWICMKVLRGSARDKCIAFNNERVPLLTILIAYGLEPKDICSNLKFCEPNEGSIIENEIKEIIPRIQQILMLNKTVNCKACLLFTQLSSIVMKSQQTEALVLQKMYLACSAMPKLPQELCIDFANKYGHQIYDSLVMKYKPDQICTKLERC